MNQARLKKLLRYNPKTGEFFWRTAKSQRVRVGERAGYAGRKGYREIAIDHKRYSAHRLAWLYVYGKFPGHLDHKNRNIVDNRISNLREATHSQNQFNVKARSKSGLKGAYFQPRSGNWYSMVMREGKSLYLGTFYTPEKAHAAYCRAAKKLHGEFFCSG
jgi:hypothetical protein